MTKETSTVETLTNRAGFPAETCPKCYGEGKITKYDHVDAGVCFKCNGEGVILRGKSAKAYDAYRAAVTESQRGTVADITTGTKFLAANQWHTATAEPTIDGDRVNIKTNRGSVGWTGVDFPARIYRPEAAPAAADFINRI